MKKTKKLLSVLLAVLMVLSSMTVMAYAYGDYSKLDAKVYDSNDMPRGALLTVEQRASYVMDLLDGILKSADLVNDKYLGMTVNLTSFNGICDTFNGNITNLMGAAGDLRNLSHSAITGNKITSREANGDTASLLALLQLAGDNKHLIDRVLAKGSLDLGSLLSLFGVKIDLAILKDIPSLLGGVVYGLGSRQLTNGIGDDPEWPNSVAWDDLKTKPTIDEMVKNLVVKLLMEPRHTTSITDPSQNTLGDQALTEEIDGVTYYYCYGVSKDGTLITEAPSDDAEKIYLSHWDESSILLPDFDSSLIDFTSTSVYELVEKLIPWAYDTFGAHNLDAQFRSTLMQAAGAVNEWVADEDIQEQLKVKMAEYKAIQDNGDRWDLSNAFAAADGFAGDYNFMYISLGDAKSINEKPDNLYFVVEWGGSYEYYHVNFSEVNPFFELGNWEYQINSWKEVCNGYEAGTSILAHLNDILGNIVNEAVPTANWTMGANSNIIDNIVKIVKQFIKANPSLVFADGELPEGFDSMTAEEGVVLAGKMIIPSLLKAIILPEDVSSVEELIVYCVREFTDEILQEYGAGWDAKIEAAAKLSGSAKEDAFLDIALNMGLSIGAYYLKNIAGLGTFVEGHDTASATPVFKDVPMGPTHEWKEILSYIVDWVIDLWLPRLSYNIVSKNQAVFEGDDGLAKLSAIFSALFPSTAKVLGCSSDSFALDLQVVYNNLRDVLNGDFTALLKALERKESGTLANYSISKAIITLVKELFGGAGLEESSLWNNSWKYTWKTGIIGSTDYTRKGLATFLDDAANSATPIQSLVGAYGGSDGSDELGNLAGALIGCLSETRNRWAFDAIGILASFTLLGSLKYSGAWYDGKDAYTGADSFKVDFTVGFDVGGAPAAFNDGAYRSGTTEVDPNYIAEVTRAEILDENGKVVSGSAITVNRTLQPNTYVELSTNINSAPEQAKIYTVVAYYKVTAPDGELLNEGNEMTLTKSIIVTAQKNDSLTPNEQTVTDTVSKTYLRKTTTLNYNATYGITNTYISDAEPLKAAENIMLMVTDNSTESGSDVGGHSTSKVYIDGYGWNIVDEETGRISVRQSDNASGALTDLTKFFTVTKDGEQLNNDDLQALWFKWNINGSDLNTDGGAGTTRNGQIWLVEDGAGRSEFTEDFTTYKIVVSPRLEYNYRTYDWKGSASSESKNQTIAITSYINLYNGYGIDEVLGAALNAAYTRDMFKDGTQATQAWNAYQTALNNAVDVRYGKWVGETFAEDHTQDGVSTFKIASEALSEAIEKLLTFMKEDDEAVVTVVAPSDPSSELHHVYLALEELAAKSYRHINFALYRWAKYSDLRNDLMGLIEAATPPSTVVNDHLVGVDLDNAGIAGVIAAIDDAKISDLVGKLVVPATEEEKAAAQEAFDNFVMPEYDLQSVNNDLKTMLTNEDRLIAKYSDSELANLHHYLKDSIAKYGKEVASNYTEASFAAYTAALEHAKEVEANAKAQPSELHAARYDFQVAYKALIKTEDAVDLSALKEIMAKAKEILANIDDYKLSAKGEENFEDIEEALKDLILKAGYVVNYEDATYYIGGEYTGEYALSQEGLLTGANKQKWVNEITDRVTDAVGNFESALAQDPELFPREPEHTDSDVVYDENEDHNGVVDEVRNGDITNGYLYGITVGQDILQVFHSNAKLETVANDKGVTNGTGATVKLLYANGELYKVYTVVIFGDVDGDADISLTDAFVVQQNALGSSTLEGAYEFAADVDGSGDISLTDAFVIQQGALGSATVTTNPYTK